MFFISNYNWQRERERERDRERKGKVVTKFEIIVKVKQEKFFRCNKKSHTRELLSPVTTLMQILNFTYARG